ncbi:MAG: hypothetical protein JO340_02520 [Acidobacteriaceae bacterium]|nr:hypothetical protein [Acidobacteriaceae bacterium]
MRILTGSRSFLLPPIALLLLSCPVLRGQTPDACKNLNQQAGIVVTFDWNTPITKNAGEIQHSGDYCFVLKNANPLYAYSISNQISDQQTNAFADLASVIKQLPTLFSGTAPKSAPTPEAQKRVGILEACAQGNVSIKKAMDQFTSDAKAVYPQPDSKGNYASETLEQTKRRWEFVKLKLQTDLANMKPTDACVVDADTQSAIDSARATINAVQDALNNPKDTAYVLPLKRTDDLVITVTESYNGQTTKTGTFELTPTWTIYTVSGGFLLTTLPAPTYNSRTVPNASGTGTQNVLEVDNASGIRPALTGLINFNITPDSDHSPLGLAASTGIVYDISNGKADTSHFGIFAGPSIHLFNRFIVTAGYHFGEFADYPPGYRNGQVIPPNTGTPTASNRWSARLAFAFTYQFKSSRQKTTSTETTKQPKTTKTSNTDTTAR